MALTDGEKTNYQTLMDAFNNNDVAMVETTRKDTGARAILLCAMGWDTKTEEYTMSPFAEMIPGDPLEIYEEP